MSNKALAYRPDIDGLRAVAVMAVVIFHFNKQWLPGGFVGVDIFFVISGFLITGIVARQAAAGSFSFVDFYMRRVRRILPAALFATLVTLFFGSIFMLPDDAKALSLSAVAATLSAANIYFWSFLDTSYFAASSDTVPLLHMWSLGVEEQFYLIWPALLLFTLKIGGRKMTVGFASIIAGVCFWYGQSKLTTDPTFAYYMLPSRAGELLIGSITFFLTDMFKNRVGKFSSQLMAFAGAFLLICSLAFIRETEGFPGFISIVPSLGAAFVIAGGYIGKNFISSSLALRPMVIIGLGSFSLYLWHWPVLAFYRYAYGEPTAWGNVICLSLIIIFTLFSYWMIEVPFRSKKENWKLILAVPFSGALTLSLAGFLYSNNGLINLLNPTGYQSVLNAQRSGSAPAATATYVCQSLFKPEFFTSDKCVAGDISKPPTVLLIGDSNAAHYAGYLSEIAKVQGVAIRNVEHHSCPPFPGDRSVRYVKKVHSISCPAYNEEVLKQIKNYDTIIVGGSWPGYYSVDKVAFLQDFDAMLDTLSNSGKKVIVALKIPTFSTIDRQCSEKSLKIPLMDCAANSTTPDKGETLLNKEIMKRISARQNFSYFGVRDLICNGDTCSAYSGKTQLYFDSGHLSREGSEKLGRIALESKNIPKSLSSISNPHVATN